MLNTKQKIINTAIKLFALKGFDSVTTREIASLAGVNLSLIAYYFKTKDNLYLTIVDSISNHGLEYLKDEMKSVENLESMTKEEKTDLFCRFLYKYLDYIYSENVPKDFIILMIKEQVISSSKYGRIYQSKSQIFYRVLRQILASITNRRKDDTAIVFEICLLITEVLSFKVVENIVLRGIRLKEYGENEKKKIKELLKAQIKASLERLNVKVH